MSPAASTPGGPLAEHALAKPGAWADQPWEGDHVAKVAEKIFCFLGDEAIGVACGTRAEADEWIAEFPDDASVMPYIGRHGWNTLRVGGAIPEGDPARGDRHVLRPRRRQAAEVQAPDALSARPAPAASRRGPGPVSPCSAAPPPVR